MKNQVRRKQNKLKKEVLYLNRKIVFAVLALAAVLLAVPYIGIVHAKPSTVVSGAIMVTGFVPLETLPKGQSGNVVMKVMLTAEFTGDIAGTTTYEAFWMIRYDDGGLVTGANIHEIMTFETATVLDKSGSLTIEANLGSNRPSDAVWHWTILGGTGELANLHGHGTWAPENPGDVVEFYEGQVHFNP
jgi:hypothetical protein